MSEAKAGDKVQLKSGEGIFVDYETGLEVTNKNTAVLGEIGERTKLALQSGGLLIVSEGKKAAVKNDDSDLPSDLPGRDVFLKAGMNFETVKNLDFEVDKVPGIGAKTIEALKTFLSA